MSPRAWLFVVALIAADALLVWLELRRVQPREPLLRPFFERIALKYRQLRGRA